VSGKNADERGRIKQSQVTTGIGEKREVKTGEKGKSDKMT